MQKVRDVERRSVSSEIILARVEGLRLDKEEEWECRLIDDEEEDINPGGDDGRLPLLC